MRRSATVQTGVLILALAASTLSLACSASGKLSGAKAAAEEEEEDAKPKKKKATKAPEAPAEKSEDKADTPGDLYDDLNGGDEGEDEAEKLLADCGTKKYMAAKDDEEIYSNDLTSEPFKLSRAGTVVARTQSSTTKKRTTTNNSAVASGSYKGIVQDIIDDESTGTILTDALESEDMLNIRENDGWDDIVCTIAAIRRIEQTFKESHTIVEFDKPLPQAPSPLANKARFKAEKPERTFTGITAKIVASDHDDLDDLKEVTGEVDIEELDGHYEGKDGFGKAVTVDADIAFRVTNRFGEPEVTRALGLSPVITYYISFKKKAFVALVIDPKDEEIEGEIIFLAP